MKPKIIKSFTQNDINYRIVETYQYAGGGTHSPDKYMLEYETADIVGERQWRSMIPTSADLKAHDPVAPLLAELRALGWF